MADGVVEAKGESREESYAGHTIYVEPNPDHYRGGFEWSVCKDGAEIQSGLEFSASEALKSARQSVDALAQ